MIYTHPWMGVVIIFMGVAFILLGIYLWFSDDDPKK